MMLRKFSILCIFFISGVLLFFTWSGYVEREFHVVEYRGKVIRKHKTEHVLDIGTSLRTQPSYRIVFSSGKELEVPYSVYQQINKGMYTVIMKQKDHMVISK